jgi:hypothetical protein
LQLTAQEAQTITPGTSDKTIAADRYLTGVQTVKGDSKLIAANIKKGVTIFNVTGNYEAAVAPVIPSTCIAYLGGNGRLYIKEGASVSAAGLTSVTSDREGWDAYSGSRGGAFAGSVLSEDGVYLEWDGFSDLTQKYTIHTLIGDTSASGNNDEGKYAWGFEQQDYNWEDNYEISGLEMYWRTAGYDWDGVGAKFYDGWHWRSILKAGLLPAAFTWDGPGNVAVNLITARGDRYKRTLMYPYDEEMGGMPGTKYIVGNKLYLGKPPRYTNGTSGAAIGGFALEVGSSGYTDGATYISPLLDGTYKNL